MTVAPDLNPLVTPLHWEDVPVSTSADQFALPVGTVTLLLADVEGSTRLWEHEPGAMSAAVGRHDGVLAEILARHGGVRPVEQGEGDSFVAAFSRPSDAVAAALALQLEDLAPVRLRIGIHTGEVQLRDAGNYIGQTVNRTARLRDIGHGGQVLLSHVTAELVADRLPDGAWLDDLGEHRLRDLARPERVAQLRHPDLVADFPALRALDSLPHNLPTARTSFVGRDKEMAEVIRLLEGTTLLTFTGSGGCGKTRLALQVGAASLDAHPDGVWWVDLAPVADAALVATAVASALSLKEDQVHSAVDVIARRIGSRRMLLILDNCEHVLSACRDLVDSLFTRCPSLRILATSREPLGISGETAWVVPSLSVPDTRTTPQIGAIGAYEAVQLFIERATKARPNFVVTNDNAAAVAQICQRLDGIPFAIELAAARARLLTPQQICDGLADRFRLLTGGSRTAMPRQQTLEASVDWSHDLLSEAERAVFRRLAVFAGSFDLDAAEAVCSGDEVEAHQVLDLVGSLVDRSLVEVDDGARTARYSLLQTTRQYAAARLAASGEDVAVRSRHCDHYFALSEQAEGPLWGPGQLEWSLRLAGEADNLRAAFSFGLDRGREEDVLRAVTATAYFWVQRDPVEGARWLKAAAGAMEGAPPGLRARGLLVTGFLGWQSGELELVSLFLESRQLAQEAGETVTEARAAALFANFKAYTDPPSAVPLLEEALVLARQSGDAYAMALASTYWAFTQFGVHGKRVGQPLVDAAIATVRRLGIPDMLGECLISSAGLVLAAGDLARAKALNAEGAELAADLGYEMGLAMTEVNWCMVALLEGRYADALGHAATIRARMAEVNPSFPDFGLVLDGCARLASGDLRARGDVENAIDGVRATFTGQVWAWLITLAVADVVDGDLEAARRHVADATELAGTSTSAFALFGWTPRWFASGLLARAEDDWPRSADLLHDSLRDSHEAAMLPSTLDSLESLAGVLVHLGQPESAVRLLAAARQARDEAGLVRFRLFHTWDEEDLAVAREGLGDDAFAAAWADGSSLSLDDAVAYAERGRGERKRPASGWASLTPAERNVVGLVAEGLSNPAIGERLFISKRTVQAHLTSVFAKLGVSSRSELAAEATRRAGQTMGQG